MLTRARASSEESRDLSSSCDDQQACGWLPIPAVPARISPLCFASLETFEEPKRRPLESRRSSGFMCAEGETMSPAGDELQPAQEFVLCLEDWCTWLFLKVGSPFWMVLRGNQRTEHHTNKVPV